MANHINTPRAGTQPGQPAPLGPPVNPGNPQQGPANPAVHANPAAPAAPSANLGAIHQTGAPPTPAASSAPHQTGIADPQTTVTDLASVWQRVETHIGPDDYEQATTTSTQTTLAYTTTEVGDPQPPGPRPLQTGLPARQRARGNKENVGEKTSSNSFLRLKFKSKHKAEKAAQAASGGSAQGLSRGKESGSMSATGSAPVSKLWSALKTDRKTDLAADANHAEKRAAMRSIQAIGEALDDEDLITAAAEMALLAGILRSDSMPAWHGVPASQVEAMVKTLNTLYELLMVASNQPERPSHLLAAARAQLDAIKTALGLNQ